MITVHIHLQHKHLLLVWQSILDIHIRLHIFCILKYMFVDVAHSTNEHVHNVLKFLWIILSIHFTDILAVALATENPMQTALKSDRMIQLSSSPTDMISSAFLSIFVGLFKQNIYFVCLYKQKIHFAFANDVKAWYSLYRGYCFNPSLPFPVH